mgnify:CR=1 FL=1
MLLICILWSINHKSIKMKKILSLILFLLFTISFSQENPIVYLDYVTVLNTDIEKHINAEKNIFSKMHKEQIDMGNKIGWDMWQISNNRYGEPTTTFLYVHINTDSNMSYTPSKIFTEYELREHQEQYASRIVKTGNLTLSIKGSYGIKPGDKPFKYMVANYMAVDVYKQYEYEQMELKSAGPNYAQNGRSGWGFGKILSRFGTNHEVNYLTFDFYNSMNDILNLRSNTFKFTKSQLAIWKSQDKLRELKNSHIMTLIASER